MFPLLVIQHIETDSLQPVFSLSATGTNIWTQAFSQKGVQASWDALRTKMDAFGRPNSGGISKLFSIISLSILIYLKRNSFNSHYYYTFDILINLMVYLGE
jgi:hypothetical protein